MERSFLIVHGWQGSGPGHWQPLLASYLHDAGEDVRFPALPEADAPSADAWAAVLHAQLADMPGERTVVCHSLGCMLWAREAARIAAERPVERVLLVAPICPVTPLPGVRGFFPVALDADAVAASAGEIVVASGDADPYCPAGVQRTFAAPLGLDAIVIPGAGHVNVEAGYGWWPEVVDWCQYGTPVHPQGAKNGVET